MSNHVTITLSSGRDVRLPASGHDCRDRWYRGELVCSWFCQISPTFVAMWSDGGLDDALEESADLADAGDDSDYLQIVYNECLADGDTEADAWERAYGGSLSLNGGAEWIDSEDFGLWSPTAPERREIISALRALDALHAADWICSDCAMMIANGEAPCAATENEAETLAESCHGWVLLSDPSESGMDREEFSTNPCSCCGSRLCGGRHAAVYTDPVA
jgi:hypothetical protein